MEELDAYKLLLENTFWLELNANDFFARAADMVEFDPLDLKWALPIIQEYDQDGIYAVMSFIDKTKPLQRFRNRNFRKAYRELLKLNPEIYSNIK